MLNVIYFWNGLLTWLEDSNGTRLITNKIIENANNTYTFKNCKTEVFFNYSKKQTLINLKFVKQHICQTKLF